MAMDRRKKPQRLGQNLDHSDDDCELVSARGLGIGTVQYNGVEYD